jgi:hypothetical protein
MQDTLTAFQRQQHEALATLRQQQQGELAAQWQQLERLFAEQRALTQQVDDVLRRVVHGSAEAREHDHVEDASAEYAVDRVAQTHEAQAVHVVWSAHAEASIAEHFARIQIPGAMLLDTECRTTVCRLEVAFMGDESHDDVLQLLPHVIPWSAEGLLHVDAQTQTVIFYVAREGESLRTAH